MSAPLNDNIANRILKTGTSFSLIGTNVDATIESGEGALWGDDPDVVSSVWYEWTAPRSGTVLIQWAEGTHQDVTVYSGSTVFAEMVNEGNGGESAYDSSFSAVGGTKYYIQVTSYQLFYPPSAFSLSFLYLNEAEDPEEADAPELPSGCSSNPVFCLLDLLTNKRYGLGNFMSLSDFDADLIYADADYCDELVDDGDGGEEVRHRLDVVIDSRTKAIDLISQLSASFRGMPFYSMGKVNLRIDREQESSVQMFGMGNIVKDSFQQKWKSDKQRYNMLEVQFLDKDKDYQQETIVVIDEDALESGEEQKPHKIRLFVTRLSEAIREGRYALKVSKYIDKIVSFQSAMSAIVCQPNDRIDISHDVPSIGASGVIKEGSTNSTIILDREVTIESAKTYKLKILFGIDDSLEEREVTNAAGTTDTITVSPAFTLTPAKYDKFAFGEENILVQPLRVINISRDNHDLVSLECVPYNSNVYTEEAITLPETQYSTLQTGFPLVTNLNVIETQIRSEDGLIGNRLDVSFIKPILTNYPINSYSYAKIYISDNGGTSWVLAGTTNDTSFFIEENIVPNQTYRVAVVTVNSRGVESSLATAPYKDVTTHTTTIFQIDLWALNREYKLTNVDRIQANYFDSEYCRDVFVLNTADTWAEAEGEDWDGFDLSDRTVEASGSIEYMKSFDLGLKSKYLFSPSAMFKNIAGGSVTAQISTSDDDITFSAFADIDPDLEYSTRYVKFKFLIATTDTDEQVGLYSEIIGIDSPRVVT